MYSTKVCNSSRFRIEAATANGIEYVGCLQGCDSLLFMSKALDTISENLLYNILMYLDASDILSISSVSLSLYVSITFRIIPLRLRSLYPHLKESLAKNLLFFPLQNAEVGDISRKDSLKYLVAGAVTCNCRDIRRRQFSFLKGHELVSSIPEHNRLIAGGESHSIFVTYTRHDNSTHKSDDSSFPQTIYHFKEKSVPKAEISVRFSSFSTLPKDFLANTVYSPSNTYRFPVLATPPQEKQHELYGFSSPVKDVEEIVEDESVEYLNDERQCMVWTCGSGANGVLGHGDTQSYVRPKLVVFFLRHRLFIASVSCGSVHTMIRTSNGEVYSWGSGSCGRLGHGNENNQLVPKRLENIPDRVAGISCGEQHSAILTDVGECYTFGRGTLGRLGHGTQNDEVLPRVVEALSNQFICQVACGSYFTCLLTAFGKVFSCGLNNHYQCGLENRRPVLNPSGPVKNLPKISELSCGEAFVLAVREDRKEIWSWGCQSYRHCFSCIGSYDGEEKFFMHRSLDWCIPRIIYSTTSLESCNWIYSPFRFGAHPCKLGNTCVSEISTGSQHALIRLCNGSVHSFGLGTNGRLGFNDTLFRSFPTPVCRLSSVHVVSIACGMAHSLVLSCSKGHSCNNLLATNKPQPLLRRAASQSINLPALNSGDFFFFEFTKNDLHEKECEEQNAEVEKEVDEHFISRNTRAENIDSDEEGMALLPFFNSYVSLHSFGYGVSDPCIYDNDYSSPSNILM